MRRYGLLSALTSIALLVLGLGCERSTDEPSPQHTPDPQPAPPSHKLIFPPSTRVEDESVNAFVTEAMEVAVAGVYDDFRLLWSAREEPLTRAEFERGWAAVEHIRIDTLKKVRLAPDVEKGRDTIMIVYAFLATVEFDPDKRVFAQNRDGTPAETSRQVVLMLVQEHEHWRLAWAPSQMRDWLRKQYDKQKIEQKPDDASPAHEAEPDPSPSPTSTAPHATKP